jgi:hypothetical protein
MNNKNTGGPAFPFPAYIYPNGEINHGEGGMDLRDYFAAKAMQGELATLCDPQNQICGLALDTSDEQLARLTKHYYRIADSMLKAREQ